MIKKSLVVGLLSAGFVAVPGMALASTQFNPAPVPVATTVSSSITASQADQAAIAAVGGGTVTSTSSDTYQGSAVFDIHVLYNSTVYDVKVLKATGGVALKKVSSEQPSSAPAPTPTPSSITASQADQAAIAAVGGGTVTSTSSDT
ncbi:MAG: PepSY domain-containing protein, partial [Ferrimicrobium sp.]